MKDRIKFYYDQIVEQVEQNKVLDDTDKVIVERLAFNIFTVEKCEEQLLNEGFIRDGLHGLKEHPAINVKNKAEANIRSGYAILGLDYLSKFKKQIVDSNKDEWSDFVWHGSKWSENLT